MGHGKTCAAVSSWKLNSQTVWKVLYLSSQVAEPFSGIPPPKRRLVRAFAWRVTLCAENATEAAKKRHTYGNNEKTQATSAKALHRSELSDSMAGAPPTCNDQCDNEVRWCSIYTDWALN